MIVVSTQEGGTKARVHAVYTDESITTNVEADALPILENRLNKNAQLYLDTVSGELFYEYTDKPLTETEKMFKAEITSLKDYQAEQDLLLMQVLLGGTTQ